MANNQKIIPRRASKFLDFFFPFLVSLDMQLICLQTLLVDHKRTLPFSPVFKESVNPQQMGLRICLRHEMICISALQPFKKGCLYFYFCFCFEEPSRVSSPQTIELYSSSFYVLDILLCTGDMGFALHHHLSHFHCVWDSLFTNMSCPIQWRRVEKDRPTRIYISELYC